MCCHTVDSPFKKNNFYVLFARADFEQTSFFLLPKTSISMKKMLKNYWRKGLPLQNFGGLAPLLYGNNHLQTENYIID